MELSVAYGDGAGTDGGTMFLVEVLRKAGVAELPLNFTGHLKQAVAAIFRDEANGVDVHHISRSLADNPDYDLVIRVHARRVRDRESRQYELLDALSTLLQPLTPRDMKVVVSINLVDEQWMDFMGNAPMSISASATD